MDRSTNTVVIKPKNKMVNEEMKRGNRPRSNLNKNQSDFILGNKNGYSRKTEISLCSYQSRVSRFAIFRSSICNCGPAYPDHRERRLPLDDQIRQFVASSRNGIRRHFRFSIFFFVHFRSFLQRPRWWDVHLGFSVRKHSPHVPTSFWISFPFRLLLFEIISLFFVLNFCFCSVLDLEDSGNK